MKNGQFVDQWASRQILVREFPVHVRRPGICGPRGRLEISKIVEYDSKDNSAITRGGTPGRLARGPLQHARKLERRSDRQGKFFMWPEVGNAAARKKFPPRQGANRPSGRQTCLRGVEIACASQLGLGHLQDAEKPAPSQKTCRLRHPKIQGQRLRRPSKPDEHFL